MTKDQILLSLIRDGTIKQIGENEYEYSKNSSTFKTALDPSTPTVLLDKFIHDSKIPFNVKTSSGITYQLTAKSDYAKKFIYNEVITSPRFQYLDMVKATELYYNNTKMARVPITKYFKEGIFEQVVQEYLKGNLETGGVKVNKVSL